jgi:hypothetical protein
MTEPDDTAAGPEPDDPPTTACDTTMADHGQLAWGSAADDETEVLRRSWPHTWGIAATVLGCAVMLAVGVYVWHAIGHHTDVQVSAPSVTAHPPVTTTVAAPPVTVTQTSTTEPPADKDARFLALMDTQHYAPNLMNRIVQAAHTVCDEIAEGNTKAGFVRRIIYSHPGEETPEQARFFVDTAVNFYCPQYNND